MRKILLILMIFISVVGCSNQIDLQQLLINNDLSTIYDNFNGSIKKSLDKEEFEEIFIDECSVLKSIVTSDDNYMEFESDKGRCQITYAINNNKISSFLINNINEKEILVNDVFKETVITVNKNIGLQGVLNEPVNNDYKNLVVFVHGSGQSDYNSSYKQLKPFEDLARGLSEYNIASIRYDKRYYALPNLITKDIDIYDEVLDDVNIIINEYKDQYDNITVIGHSLGAMLTFKIANDNEVDNIVLLGGSNRHLADIIYDQLSNNIEMQDISETEKKVAQAIVEKQVLQAKELKGDEPGYYFNVGAKYWNSLKDINGELFIDDLKANVLVLHGKEDFQVSVEKDFQSLKDLLKDYDDASFKIYDNLTHFFTKSYNKDSSDYDLDERVDQIVIDDIGNWINEMEAN